MQVTNDAFGCVGNTIRLLGGTYIDLADPKSSDIKIGDIAGGLSNLCRFGGQVPRFYSVAEHCIKATEIAEADGQSPEACFAVLMHDAAEAYCGDCVKPLKLLLGDVYSQVESRIEAAIDAEFGIEFAKHRDVIKKYDQAMLIAEKRIFCPDDDRTWPGEDTAMFIKVQPSFWLPHLAQLEFFEAFAKLWRQINDL